MGALAVLRFEKEAGLLFLLRLDNGRETYFGNASYLRNKSYKTKVKNIKEQWRFLMRALVISLQDP